MERRDKPATGRNREAILDAALRLFSQYGYRRTSIDDVAREAEIAKGTVYLSFTSKEEIFRALCQRMIDQVESEAQRGAKLARPLRERLEIILEAKYGLYFETVHRSAHAAELMDSKSRLSGDMFEKSDRRYHRLLREVFEDAVRGGEIAPARMGLDAAAATELITSAAHGVGLTIATPALYHRRLRELIGVIVTGLGGKESAPSPERVGQN